MIRPLSKHVCVCVYVYRKTYHTIEHSRREEVNGELSGNDLYHPQGSFYQQLMLLLQCILLLFVTSSF